MNIWTDVSAALRLGFDSMLILIAPTAAEWIFVYLPLAIGLLAACYWEWRSRVVPNWLSVGLLLVMFAGRGWIAPDKFGSTIGMFFLSLVVFFCAFLIAPVGGGAAKLSIAAGTGLPLRIWFGSLVTSAVLAYALGRVVAFTHRDESNPKVGWWLSWPPIFAASIAITLVAAAVFGK